MKDVAGDFCTEEAVIIKGNFIAPTRLFIFLKMY
jgi:hypothetical protein